MNLLLDTHSFIWFVAGSTRLSASAREIMDVPANRLWLSVASLWEMAIKVSLGKLKLGQPLDKFLPEQLRVNSVELLGITLDHTLALAALPFHHRDPFDRLLIAQALVEGLPVISVDPAFDAYGVNRVW